MQFGELLALFDISLLATSRRSLVLQNTGLISFDKNERARRHARNAGRFRTVSNLSRNPLELPRGSI